MTDTFTAGELVKTAVNIERSAVTFFDIMARTTDSDAARNVFGKFVDMEREHLAFLQDMVSQIAEIPDLKALPSEASDYIRALIEDDVFSSDAAMDEAVSQADSDTRALEIGIRAEKDSILFYLALKEVMPSIVLTSLDQILNDEKIHLCQLFEIKKMLDNVQ
jgi:rubrerythrin